MTYLRCLFFCLIPMMFAGQAFASPILYQPVNPIFQPGNPLAGSNLLAIAEAQKKKEPTGSSTSGLQRSIGETAQAALVSRITSDLYNDIFDCGSGCAPSGSYDFGDGSLISYVRNGGTIDITFTDPVNGTTTITVPAS